MKKFTATYPANAEIEQLMTAAQLCKSHQLFFAVQILEDEIQRRMMGREGTIMLEEKNATVEPAESQD